MLFLNITITTTVLIFQYIVLQTTKCTQFFFGGIAQYYDSLGILVQDNNVPFVKTIARVTRDASGTMAEYKLPIEQLISFLQILARKAVQAVKYLKYL